jgi:2,3-dihydroxybenzoate-AMP ligase
MLEGIVPFPPDYATRYRAKGYWEDRTVASAWEEACERFAHRVAVIDGDRLVTYAELNATATRLALNLLDEGLRPLDRIVMLLPNVLEFAFFYLALQKIGAIPIMALPTHRYYEVSQFVELSGAVAWRRPRPHSRFRLHGADPAHRGRCRPFGSASSSVPHPPTCDR